MSGISLQIDVNDLVSPRIGRLVDGLSDQGRTTLHEMMMNRVLELTREHLRELAGTRHDTANRLGAEPTGFWAQAAEKTSGTADADGATVTVSQPGIGRAAHDVTITPGAGKKFLTIPMIAAAYDQRAYRVEGLFIPKGMQVLAKSDGHGGLELWYALVSSVTQRQDRTLLPSDEAFVNSGLKGVSDYLGELLEAA